MFKDTYAVFSDALERFGPQRDAFTAPEAQAYDQKQWMKDTPRFLHMITDKISEQEVLKNYIDKLKILDDEDSAAARAEMFLMEKECKDLKWGFTDRLFSILASIIWGKCGKGTQSWYEEHTDAWMAAWREPKDWTGECGKQ